MFKKYSLILSVLATLFVDASNPTSRFLSEQEGQFIEKLFKGELRKYKKHVPFFGDIQSQEDETFFAYHGTTHYVSAIQDIIKAVVEETTGSDLPKDFVFWRIPDDPDFDYGDSVKGAYLKGRHNPVTDDLREYLADYFIFSPLNLSIDYLPTDEVDDLLLHFYHCYRFPEAIDRLEEKAVIEALAEKIDPALTAFYMNHLSYDSITKAGRSQKKKMELYKDFLLNSPPFPYSFLSYTYLNRFSDQEGNNAKLVVSCSPCLFTKVPTESAMWSFLSNNCIEDGDQQAICDLRTYAKKMGISTHTIDCLMESVMQIVEKSGVKTGVLCQIFDHSSSRFSIANNCSYLSIVCGYPIKRSEEIPVQALVEGTLPFRHHGHDLQIRLILDNATLLNPHSPIRTVKHSQLPEETRDQIHTLIKETIRAAL